MAMPMDYDGMRTDDASERTDNVDEYRRTCIDFIEDISHDYEAWVDYYKLPEEEDGRRRSGIRATITRTNQWIAKVAQSIKGVDVVMNDGIQKMAEATAGKPLEIGVFVNRKAGYVEAAGREKRRMKLGFHFKDTRFRVESTCGAYLDETDLPDGEFEIMDIHLRLHAENARSRDVISFTVTVSEMDNDVEFDRRGVSTIMHVV